MVDRKSITFPWEVTGSQQRLHTKASATTRSWSRQTKTTTQPVDDPSLVLPSSDSESAPTWEGCNGLESRSDNACVTGSNIPAPSTNSSYGPDMAVAKCYEFALLGIQAHVVAHACSWKLPCWCRSYSLTTSLTRPFPNNMQNMWTDM